MKKSKTSPPIHQDWTPKHFTLNGIKCFCSPACGGKNATCTLEAYNKAVTTAQSMCRRLGPKWYAQVHENLGWYSRAVHKSGYASIQPNHYKGRILSYDCTIQVLGRHYHGNGTTPRKAKEDAIATIKACLADHSQTLYLITTAEL